MNCLQAIPRNSRLWSRNARKGYELLGSPFRRSHTPRGYLFFLRWLPHVSLALFLLFSLLLISSGIPPSFDDIREAQDRLPQHNILASAAESRRYLHIADQSTGLGFNNILQEALLLSHLAYLSNRSYVFEDYTWSHTPLPWTIYDFALRPARIPLNAFISGPTAGMPTHSPPAVNKLFWESVCPQDKRLVIRGDINKWEDPAVIFAWWLNKLAEIEDECVELLDVHLNGQDSISNMWKSYSTSPVLRKFSWSSLVSSAVVRNFPALGLPFSEGRSETTTNSIDLSGVVSVHVRRGDYSRHCSRLFQWNSLYPGINRLSSLPDRFDPSPYSDFPELREAYYMEHCLPTIEYIAKRLRDVRLANPSLNRVHVSTNGQRWFIKDLESALLKDGWTTFSSTLDIVLDHEQKYVDVAVDMAIAEHAEVFLGNGFSSVTSNIIMLRLAKGLDPNTNRFL